MNTSPLLAFAMKEEAQDLFNEFNVLHCGIGKVNATYHLTKALSNGQRPSIVINMGTAGSRKHDSGTVINATSFIQRDMDVTPLGFERYQTPFSTDPVTLTNGLTVPALTQGVCGSGDSFDTSEHATSFDVVDMEAYALALICQREDIPFLCLKFISDGADDSASLDWNETLNKAANALYKSMHEIDLNMI